MSKELTTETKKMPISIGAFQGSRALTFNTLTEIHSFATMVCKTELAPKAYRGKPEDATIAIIYGMEIGLPPLASLQNIAVVNGSPAVYGDGQISLVQASGKYEYHKSSYRGEFPNDDFTAIFEVKRIGVKESVVKEYSIADAKRAGLWNKAGTWTTNPKLMLLYKPKSYALREAFADILKGMHSAEEMEGEQIVDVTPKSVSKTANAHTPPAALQQAFPSEPVQTDIEEEIQFSNPAPETIITDNSETAEAAFKRVSEGIKSMVNAKGLNMFFDYSSKNDLEFLQQFKPDYYVELLTLKAKRLEELK